MRIPLPFVILGFLAVMAAAMTGELLVRHKAGLATQQLRNTLAPEEASSQMLTPVSEPALQSRKDTTLIPRELLHEQALAEPDPEACVPIWPPLIVSAVLYGEGLTTYRGVVRRVATGAIDLRSEEVAGPSLDCDTRMIAPDSAKRL